ncbi:MAG: alcohol dehydrogenase catalytic domain-containing protein [Actinomycetota bacterium]|nr:alcohol dehydrogenase catalytic domain-containing protein [Actinomycetota bacterium]
MTLALEMFRSVPRYVAARTVAARLPGLLAGPAAPLRLVHRDGWEDLPQGWARVRPRLAGICGSDLNTIAGRSSFYFSPLVSFPFVPGHEVVGELLDDVGDLRAGQRVVLDPVLSCETRGVKPPCAPCARGERQLCERVVAGHLKPGLQTGYCSDTGGGWSRMFAAHRAQLHPVPDLLPDDAAVLVEPAACAVHAVRRAAVPADATVMIVGAGTVGLLTLLALRRCASPDRVLVVAKHARQAELARRYGATEVFSSSDALAGIRRATRTFRLQPEHSSSFLLGGADVTFECAGSKGAIDLVLKATRGRGRVILAAMPATADLSPVWFQELEVVGAYCGVGSFDDAIELAADCELGRFVSARYPLARWREAVEHAFSAGRLGAVKITFDPSQDD